MNYENFLAKIEKDEISNVYLFYGEEDYLKTKALSLIKKAVFRDFTAEEFNFRIFYGKDLNCADFLDEVNTFPVSSKKKLLVVLEADKLNSSSRGILSKTITAFPLFSCVIFFFQKIDRRQKLFQLIQKKDKCVFFSPLGREKLRLWIIDRFKERNKEISEEAVSFLMNQATQLQHLENEIEKVSVYAGERPQINRDDIKQCSNEFQNQTIYDLIDKIMGKDIQASLQILSKLIRDKKGTELMGLFYWQYSRLFQVKTLPGEELKIPDYYRAKFLEQAEKFSKEELKDLFYRLFQTDLNLKSSKMPPRLALELLLINLCAA